MGQRTPKSASRQRRLKLAAALPVPPDQATVPYAKCRAELKDLSVGQLTRLVLDSPAWQRVMVPVLDQLDAQRAAQPGTKPAYNSHELESVLLFQRVCGLRSYKEARDALAGDRHADARRLLGFDHWRPGGPRVTRILRRGVPSESTVSRHRKRFGERRRRGAYERLFRLLVEEHLQDPEMRAEARILALDGKVLRTHYTTPRINPKSGEVVNAAEVTCPDGGYLPPSAGPDKAGKGWNVINVLTGSGLPLSYRTTLINASERDTALDLFQREFARDVAPHLDPDKLHVLAADGAFHKQETRARLRRLGIVENIHLASHGEQDKSRREASKRNKKRILIDDYPDWFANGHRELDCRCGRGQTERRFGVRAGKAFARLEGRCRACGNITITSGQWRKAQNPERFVRCLPGDPPDWTFGNPLTFNDPVAAAYGQDRFGGQEGVHGHTLTNRFQLTKHKRWFRRADQAKTDTAMIFSIMHVAAMEQRRRARARAAQATAPPGQAAAA